MRAAILTVSSSRAAGGSPDESGPALARFAEGLGAEIAASQVVPDKQSEIEWALRHYSDSEGCDLVLSDVQMPRVDGIELTERIRAEQRYRDLPVILLTSVDAREDTERGLQAGADAYLTKGSFQQARLLEAIRRLTSAA